MTDYNEPDINGSEEVQHGSKEDANEVILRSRRMLEEDNRRNAFLEIVFPDPLQRERLRGQLALIQEENKYQLETLKAAREASLQSLVSVYDSYVKRVKASLVADTGTFVARKFTDCQSEIIQIFNEFSLKAVAQYQQAEACPVPEIREAQLDVIKQSIQGMRQNVKSLTAEFEKIVNSTVRAS